MTSFMVQNCQHILNCALWKNVWLVSAWIKIKQFHLGLSFSCISCLLQRLWWAFQLWKILLFEASLTKATLAEISFCTLSTEMGIIQREYSNMHCMCVVGACIFLSTCKLVKPNSWTRSQCLLCTWIEVVKQLKPYRSMLNGFLIHFDEL